MTGFVRIAYATETHVAVTRFVRIVSWHVIKFSFDTVGSATLCGRLAPVGAPESETLPSEKSCETCLRIATVRADVP